MGRVGMTTARFQLCPLDGPQRRRAAHSQLVRLPAHRPRSAPVALPRSFDGRVRCYPGVWPTRARSARPNALPRAGDRNGRANCSRFAQPSLGLCLSRPARIFRRPLRLRSSCRCGRCSAASSRHRGSSSSSTGSAMLTSSSVCADDTVSFLPSWGHQGDPATTS